MPVFRSRWSSSVYSKEHVNTQVNTVLLAYHTCPSQTATVRPRVSTIMLPRGASCHEGLHGTPHRFINSETPPPFKSNIEVVQIWTGLSTDLPSDPASTHSPGVPRPPARGRAQPTTAMTPTRHPPHARTVTLLSPRAASTTSSAPPLHHTSAPRRLHFSATAPRGKHACESTHTSIANAPCLSVCAFF